MIILPLSTSTTSLKVNTISLFSATPVASSAGDDEDSVGLVVSAATPPSVIVQLSVEMMLALAVIAAAELY
jgi:hypothetical protein